MSKQPKTPTPKRPDQAEQPTIWWFAVRFFPLWALLLIIVAVEPTLPLRAVGGLVGAVIPEQSEETEAYQPEPIYIVEGAPEIPDSELPPPDWDLEISPIFTAEVDYWREGIASWSVAYRVKPNLIATLMQIESCGNPSVVSPAGANGLFQVLDLHFEPGEDPFDPETNAQRGLLFIGELLAAANGDTSLAFAAYNGGPSLIDRPPDDWPNESQDYQYWASGIYEEAENGFSQSPTLIEWLNAGGRGLCQDAAQALGLN